MNRDTQYSHKLHKTIERLFKGVQTYAKSDDDKFFGSIENKLNKICSALADQLRADSCAVFFVDKDGIPEVKQELRMRGASGRLSRTLNSNEIDGKIYGSYKEKRAGARPAGLTQIAWHCGLARWANTRQEMEALRSPGRGAAHGTGKGDRYAYPGRSLNSVFRNGVMVPIFAPGRVSRPPDMAEIKKIVTTIGRCSFLGGELNRHVRFLRNHRVVGMLKAENKQPRFGPNEQNLARDFRALLAGKCPIYRKQCGLLKKNLCVNKAVKKRLGLKASKDKSYERILLGLWQQETQKKRSYGRAIRLSDSWEWNHVCLPCVDFLTKAWDSTFSNQDMELLVSVAMLLGRVLPWRTIQLASMKGMVLDENEVGSLLIRADDIEGLQSLHRAAERICSHMEFLLQRLKSDLRYDEYCRIAAAHRQGVLPVRNPISDINARTKTYASLLQKAIGRHNEKWDAAVAANERDGKPALFTQYNLVSRLMLAELYDIRDMCGVRLTCDYLSDVAQVVQAIFLLSQKWQILIRKVDDKLIDPETSGYRSVHLDLLVRAEKIVAKKDIELLKEQLCSVPDGHRNARQTFNELNDLIRKNELGEDELWFPCEVQIRTAYEDSWAGKSHEFIYKLDRLRTPIPKELEDFFTIMSNNLFETDRLSDIVQEQIREFLAPELGEGLRLKTLLRERLRVNPQEDALQARPLRVEDWPLGYLSFAVECAHELYKRNVQYGGTSQYNHAVSVVLQLVRRFGLFPDPRDEENHFSKYSKVSRQVSLFVMALLHDCWMAATDHETGLIQNDQRRKYWNKRKDVVRAVTELIKAECDLVIKRYGGLIDIELLWGSPPQKWVKYMFGFFRDYWRAELGDIPREGSSKVVSGGQDEDIGGLTFIKTPAWADMIRLAGEKDRLDACRFMAALLTERLEELPETPNVERRRGRFKEAYHVYRILRDNLQGTAGGTAVLDQCYATLRKVATQLDVEIPIHWYE